MVKNQFSSIAVYVNNTYTRATYPGISVSNYNLPRAVNI
ncbi:hypothetical protein EAKF1_ch0005 [Escherichia albertii KF1]|nr:hypothetical protein EAKF1_ch0005 [Escherichia albertii KF1]